jgi:general secretion pathway protein D
MGIGMCGVFGVRGGVIALLALASLLASCAPSLDGQNLLENRLAAPAAPRSTAAQKQGRLNHFLKSNSASEGQNFQGFVQRGTDQQTGQPSRTAYPESDLDGDEVTLNLLNASIPQAAKSVLGDALGLNYTVDARVQGAITLQTSNPISRVKLLGLFEASLRDNGAVIIASNGTYRIVPLAEAGRTTASIVTRTTGEDKPGIRPQLVIVNYVSAENMRQVLEPMLPPGMIVNTDTARNALILSGSPREIAAIQETISVFDVDWMKGMSFALVPVKSSSPAAIVQDLEQVFETKSGALKGIVRFVPNVRLKSVLVISSRSKYLTEATRWIKKMDVLAETSEAGLHVYHVQNRNASELAKILESIFSPTQAQTAGTLPQGTVAPRFDSATLGTTDQNTAAPITGGPETPAAGIDVLPSDTDPFRLAQLSADGRTRIVADDSNNALLIYGTRVEFERMKSALQELDTVPNQVLLEAVIAEVSLDDDLKFGVRWFLGQNDHGASFTDAANGAISSVFPGFSYFLKANDVGFTLNAISSVTNVRVLSAPSLVVLDNRTATLQVGDQVPVVTQSAQATTGQNAPIISNVELKDTGVILNVTPRVNDSGLVTLDIEQEVSSVTKTTTSGIDSPTIRQRKLKTSVVVDDDEALALGGLIQERENQGVSKVPVLGDVPLLGAAFRQKTDAVSRTELIIFIRPRVIRDMVEARQVTAEFRRQLSIQAPRVRRSEPTPGEELVRILN